MEKSVFPARLPLHFLYKPGELNFYPLMSSNNPFAAWNYSSDTSTPVPSIYGALPYQQRPPKTISFIFTSFNPSILNCSVVGGQNLHPYFHIITDSVSMAGYTMLKTAEGKSFALVQWQQHPTVEVRGAISRQPVSGWLSLSPDRRLLPLC